MMMMMCYKPKLVGPYGPEADPASPLLVQPSGLLRELARDSHSVTSTCHGHCSAARLPQRRFHAVTHTPHC
jgi:hypothetical protein